MKFTWHQHRRRLFAGLAVAGIGLAHFAFPACFEPHQRDGLPHAAAAVHIYLGNTLLQRRPLIANFAT